MKLRRTFIGGEGARYHCLACSVLDSAWLEAVSVHRQRPFLFLAEGVLMYFEEAQVKSLVLTLRENFPGAQLVFDAFSPFFVWANNRRVARTGIGARSHWALKRGKDLETWGDGISLLEEWFPFFALSRAFIMFDGCAIFHFWPGRLAFSTTGLDRQQGTLPQNTRKSSCAVFSVYSVCSVVDKQVYRRTSRRILR